MNAGTGQGFRITSGKNASFRSTRPIKKDGYLIGYIYDIDQKQYQGDGHFKKGNEKDFIKINKKKCGGDERFIEECLKFVELVKKTINP